MKRIFICSRYAGDTARNEAVAERLCRKAVEAGHAPFAPHLLYPRFLDDRRREERDLGIACRLAFMEACDEVWVYVGDGISDGMRRETARALEIGKPVVEIEEL